MSLAILNRLAATVLIAPWLKTSGVVGGQGLELVRGGGEGQAGDGGDLVGHLLGEADRGVQAGADRGAALGQLHQGRQVSLDAGDAVLDLLGVAAEFLAQRQRGGVLGVGAADLDDAWPRRRTWPSGLRRCLRAGSRSGTICFGAGDVHRRRIGVVRRLAHVDVVVGVDRALACPSRRPASRSRGSRSPRWRSCSTGCPSRSARPPAGSGQFSLPSMTSLAAPTMVSAIFGSSLPRARLASAAARLTMPRARTTG